MTALEKNRRDEELRLRNDLRTRERDFTKLYGKSKKMTAGEFMKAAREAGADSLGIFSDLEQEACPDLGEGSVIHTTIPQPALGVATTIPGCNCQECRRQHRKNEEEEA